MQGAFHTSVFEGYSNWENITSGEVRDLSMFWRCGISQAPVLFACLSTMPADDHEVNNSTSWSSHSHLLVYMAYRVLIISFTELSVPLNSFRRADKAKKKNASRRAYIYHKVKNEYFHCKPRNLTPVNLNCGYSSVLWFYTSICIAGFNIGFSLLKDKTGRLVMPYIL